MQKCIGTGVAVRICPIASRLKSFFVAFLFFLLLFFWEGFPPLPPWSNEAVTRKRDMEEDSSNLGINDAASVCTWVRRTEPT